MIRDFFANYIVLFSMFGEFLLLSMLLYDLFVTPKRYKGVGKYVYFVLVSLCFTFIYERTHEAISSWFGQTLHINIPIYIIYHFVYGAFFLFFLTRKIKTYGVMFLTFFSVGGAFLRFLMDTLLRLLSVDAGMGMENYSLFSNIIIFLLLILWCYFLKRFFAPGVQLPWYYIAIISSFLLSLLVFLAYAGGIAENRRVFTVFLASMVLLISTLYLLFYCLVQDIEKQKNGEMMLQEQLLKQEHIEEVQGYYQQLRGLRHELKNHILYIQTLLENSDYSRLDECTKLLKETLEKTEQFVETGNITVNAILQAFMTRASQAGVPVLVIAALPAELHIKDGALFSLLSNLFNNALEGVNSEDPLIQVEMKIVKAYLSITVSNSVSSNVLEDNPDLATTKTQSSQHGFGTQVIQNIVSKYNGILEYYCENGMFSVSILLLNEE